MSTGIYIEITCRGCIEVADGETINQAIDRAYASAADADGSMEMSMEHEILDAEWDVIDRDDAQQTLDRLKC